ncbi:hypothetical protein Tco_0742003 [Tanacetum coccineum]
MACSLSHTDSEVEALVQKLIDEDKGRQNAIMDLGMQFENACTAKDDLRNAYEKYNDISQESRALIDSFLKEDRKLGVECVLDAKCWNRVELSQLKKNGLESILKLLRVVLTFYV